MLGLFKKKAQNAAVEIKKVEKRDLMQAIVGASILVAYADGELEKSEQDSLEKLLRANENLTHFGSEITTTMQRFIDYMEAGPRLGRVKIMREIADIKNNPLDAEEVFANAVTIAEADGGVEPAELAVLTEIGRSLGVRLADYGLAA